MPLNPELWAKFQSGLNNSLGGQVQPTPSPSPIAPQQVPTKPELGTVVGYPGTQESDPYVQARIAAIRKMMNQ